MFYRISKFCSVSVQWCFSALIVGGILPVSASALASDAGGREGGAEIVDDFAAAEAALRQAEESGDFNGDIKAVERELAQIRAAERKAEEARIERERRERLRETAERLKQMDRYRTEVQPEVDALPTISADEIAWDGID